MPFRTKNLRTFLKEPYTNYGTGYRSEDDAILQYVIGGRGLRVGILVGEVSLGEVLGDIRTDTPSL